MKPVPGILGLVVKDMQVVGGAGVPTVIWETHRDLVYRDLAFPRLYWKPIEI